MVTLNKPVAGDTDWATEINDNWTALEKLALELIETKSIGAATQEVTFSGLNGDTDGTYVLAFTIKHTAASAIEFTIEPNNTTSNQLYRAHGLGDSNTIETDSGGTLLFARSASINPSYASGFFVMNAKTGVNRTLQGLSVWNESTAGMKTRTHWAHWTDTSTNITSLDVRASAANGLGAGTVLSLYKLKR